MTKAHAGHSSDATRPAPRLDDLDAPAPRVWQFTVAWHPDPACVGSLARLPASAGALALGRQLPAFAVAGGTQARAGLDDPHVSRRACRLTPVGDGWRIERVPGASRLRVNGREVTHGLTLTGDEVRQGVSLALGHRVLLHARLQEGPVDGATRPARDFGLLGVSQGMQRLRARIEQLARGDDDVLLVGPTGTGKELVARALHGAGDRAAGPWVAVNMAAIPPDLAAASLFGARRGAFTGAHEHQRGFFARAAGGTLFLDEVGDTPAALQPLLLRALQEREIQVLGGTTEPVDVRVISAMERDPDDPRLGFRRALRHRLAVQEIRLPGLAQRAEDIGLLALAFFRECARGGGPDLLADIADAEQPRWLRLFELLLAHDWPGNVRELEHGVGQIVAASAARLTVPGPLLERLRPEPAEGSHDGGVADADGDPAAGDAETAGARVAGGRLADLDEEAFLTAWRDARFEVATLARRLGVSRAAIYRRVRASRRCRLAGDVPLAELLAALDRCRGNLARTAEHLAVSRRGLEGRLRATGVSAAPGGTQEPGRP